MTWLRETPKAFATIFLWKQLKKSRIMTSDTVKTQRMIQWAIRRLEPNSAMIGQGSVSETAKASVNNEGLINPSLLKVQSSLIGNYKESPGEDLLFPTKKLYSTIYSCLYGIYGFIKRVMYGYNIAYLQFI